MEIMGFPNHQSFSLPWRGQREDQQEDQPCPHTSCYAPTFGASRAAKDSFFDHLQEALGEIPPSEPYVVQGDFNARVGSRSPTEGEQGEKSRGPHRFGELNDAGKELYP